MTRVRSAALAILASVAVAACGDNPTDPGTTLTLSIVSGNNQVVPVGTALAAPLTVELENLDGDPVSGRTVTWALVSSAGPNAILGATSTTTGADGTSSVSFTVGDVAGSYQVRGTVGSSSVTFEALATQAGPACTPDSEAPLVDLAPGESQVVTDADLACVRLPAHASAASYEVIVTPLPDVLAFNSITLRVQGGAAPPPPAPAVASQPPATLASIQESDAASRDLQYELDRHLRELERPDLPFVRAQASRPAFGLMEVPTAGEQRDFRFSCIDTDSRFPESPDTIRAEVVLVSDKAVVWEDVTSPGVFDPATYAEIAATFDDVIYAADTTYFGAPADIDGNGRISLLYTPAVNGLTNQLQGSYSGSFIAGFFCSADLFGSNHNQGEMFYLVVPDPNGDYVDDNSSLSEAVVRLQTDNTIAHEFQHMINAQTGSGATDEVWINEGLSHLAEEVVGHRSTGFTPGSELGPEELLASQNLESFFKYYVGNFTNLRIYLESPQDTAALLNSEDPLEYPNGTARMRGASWSFLRYLLDRFASPGDEWQKTRQLINDGATTNSRQAVTNVFGTDFEDLAADWSAMFAIEDRDDVAGTPDAKLTLPSYRLIDVYESSQSAGFAYPLDYLARSLGSSSAVATDLFTATARYVRLVAPSASGATSLRLETPAGGDLPTAWRTRMVIVRTQ